MSNNLITKLNHMGNKQHMPKPNYILPKCLDSAYKFIHGRNYDMFDQVDGEVEG